jgi:tripeptidyl-peptidase-1
MFTPAFVALLSLVGATAGALVPHDSRLAPLAGFIHQGTAPGSQTITLRVGLASANIAGLEQKLNSISNPTSSEYGQWLTAGKFSI